MILLRNVSNAGHDDVSRGQADAILLEMKTQDSVEYSRCSGLDGLEVMSARWLEHSFAPHMHDFLRRQPELRR
jgi:hypothetical protein